MFDIPSLPYSEYLLNVKYPDKSSSEYEPFWTKHINICKSGVYTGGIYISGWLYYHLNFFKTELDVKDQWGNSKRDILHPNFRDNEFLLDFYIRKAEQEKKPLMIFGTRRFAKTVFLASRARYRTTMFPNSRALLVCGSSVDLKEIENYINQDAKMPLPPFEKMESIGSLEKNQEIQYLFKDKSQNNFIRGTIMSRNVEAGKKSKALSVAGVTPSEVVFDEVGKYLFSEVYSNLKPALQTDLGEPRCSTIFTGTGGNIENSKDAENIFLNSYDNGFLSVDFNDIRELIKGFDFRQISDSDTGLFVPGQMSNKGGEKILTPLTEFFKQDFTPKQAKELEGFNIRVTNWDRATILIQEEIESEYKKSEKKGQMAEMAFPRQPEDCFKHSEINDYNVSEINITIRGIRESGNYGKNVIFKETPEGVQYELSQKLPCLEFPFQGGAYDAPVVIYEDRMWEHPSYGTYIAGFDLYKTATSQTTTSMGTIYVMRRDKAMNVIVASYATRPSVPEYMYRQVELLLEYYNATCMCEKEDMLPFEKYMERKGKLHLLAKGLSLTKQINPKTMIAGEYGFSATPPKNRQLLSSCSINYVNQVHEVHMEDDMLVSDVGARFIPDIMLLQELRDWGKYKNYDRKSAFEQALVLCYSLDTDNIVPMNKNNEEQPDQIPYWRRRQIAEKEKVKKHLIKKRF